MSLNFTKAQSHQLTEALTLVGNDAAVAHRNGILRGGEEVQTAAANLQRAIREEKEHKKGLTGARHRVRDGIIAVIFQVREENHGRMDRLPEGFDSPRMDRVVLASRLVKAFVEDPTVGPLAASLGRVVEAFGTHTDGQVGAKASRRSASDQVLIARNDLLVKLISARQFIETGSAPDSAARQALKVRRSAVTEKKAAEAKAAADATTAGATVPVSPAKAA